MIPDPKKPATPEAEVREISSDREPRDAEDRLTNWQPETVEYDSAELF